jgi:NAD(P)-dependent dehydrogenase (short-subunit alcohol dehydrogenase family)
MKLIDKTAVITGAGTGIGKAISMRFASEGAKVAILDINMDGARKVVQSILESGGKAAAYECDVADHGSVAEIFKKIHEDFGVVDILVNNAGGAIVGGGFQKFSECTDEYMEKIISLNLCGTLHCTREVVKEMKNRRQGKIINFSSIRGIVGDKSNVLYGAAKGGIISFTKSLAMEMGEYGVTVNAISPGAIASRPGPAKCPTFLNRAGSCEEVAALALFLVSEDGNFITGRNIVIDGGRILGAKGD